MRKILSILLVLGFSLGPSAIPAGAWAWSSISRSSESRLPACCRRDGRHHCAMAGRSASASREISLSSYDPCPCLPRAMASTVPQPAALIASDLSSHSLPAQFVAPPARDRATGFERRRSWPKRGPPSLSLL